MFQMLSGGRCEVDFEKGILQSLGLFRHTVAVRLTPVSTSSTVRYRCFSCAVYIKNFSINK